MEVNNRAYGLAQRSAALSGFMTAGGILVFNLGIGGVVWYSVTLYEKGEITIGGISSFILYLFGFIIVFVMLGFSTTNIARMTGASRELISIMKHIPGVNC